MKRLMVTLVVTGAVAVPALQAAFTGTLKLASGPYQVNPGGEFTVTETGPLASPFQTFCTERSEYLAFGQQYDYRINSGAVQGSGLAGGADTFDPNTLLRMDTISIGTAYLYSQFRLGTLAGYNVDRAASAAALQNAIWKLEGEAGSLDGKIGGPAGLTVSQILYYKFGGDLTLWDNNASFAEYGVVALNLFNGGAESQDVVNENGVHYRVNQDVLGMVPEPSTMIAGVLLLLPFGASTLRILRRKA